MTKAMILAAGYGTRMRPITYTLPKPMVPVCNRPLIAWAVEAFIRAGVRDVVVNLHHLPEPIERYLHDCYAREATFHFSREEEILGTGGGVRRVREQLESAGEFFLVNGDTIQFPKWDAMRDARRANDALAALALRHPPTNDRFTPVFYENGRVTGFGKGSGEALMFGGAHCISSRIFQLLPEKEFSGIVDEVYQPALDAGTDKLAAVIDDGVWFDIGTPQRYTGATRALHDATLRGEIERARGSRIDGDSIIDESARITGRLVHAQVGAQSNVEGDLLDSVVWDRCRIAKGARLERCVVAHDVEIAEPLQLTDALVTRDETGLVITQM
ncbi:MAG TPA: NDP-sugar synthase [Thermoanaerobaculia bacterium]